MKVIPDPIGPGQESVWSYPRPPVAEPSQRRLKIVHRGVIIADTRKGIRTPEPAIPPTSYFPPADIAPSVLQPSRRRCFCEWKGDAIHFDVVVRGETLRDVAWSYPDPNPAFRSLRDHVAFYAWPFDGGFVYGQSATLQLEIFGRTTAAVTARNDQGNLQEGGLDSCIELTQVVRCLSHHNTYQVRPNRLNLNLRRKHDGRTSSWPTRQTCLADRRNPLQGYRP
jgi:uncharacterized protein (DUF427 family)